MLEVDTSPEVHMEGASNLLALDLRLTREKMRQLLRALEEKSRLMELLDRFLDLPPGELDVRVGLEEIHPAMKDLALIGVNVRIGSGLPAKVAVLGPHAHALRARDGGGSADQPGARECPFLELSGAPLFKLGRPFC
jgi:heat-inducible transcriptional repressor